MALLGTSPGLEIVDDEGRPTRLVDPTRPKAPPRAAPADKPLDGPTTKSEVERALCVVYNLAHKILHDEIRYRPGDFGEEADGLIELLNQHGVLRIALRIIAPLAMVGSIIEKVEGTVARARERKANEPPAPGTTNPTLIVETAPNGLTPDQIRARPFAR